MSEQKSTTVFSLEKIAPLTPLVINTHEVNSSLGFQVQEGDRSEITRFGEFYKGSVVKQIAKDPTKLMGDVMVDSLARSGLQPPHIRVLERDGKIFYEVVLSNRLTLITGSQPIETIVRNGARIEGYVIEHAFLSGANNQSIDLLSLRRGNNVRNIFTFSGADPEFAAAREYRGLTEEYMLPFVPDAPVASSSFLRKRYDPEVIISSFVTEAEDRRLEWYPDELPLAVLHENAHSLLYDSDRYLDVITRERRVNAVALKTAREINRLYPNDYLFDLTALKDDVQFQMQEGYGKTRRDKKDDLHTDSAFTDELGDLLKNRMLLGS